MKNYVLLIVIASLAGGCMSGVSHAIGWKSYEDTLKDKEI